MYIENSEQQNMHVTHTRTRSKKVERSNEPTIRAGVGIRQRIARSCELYQFFSDLKPQLEACWPTNPRATAYQRRQYGYEMYDMPARHSITVAEREEVARAAQRNHRGPWHLGDVANVTEMLRGAFKTVRLRYRLPADFTEADNASDIPELSQVSLPSIAFSGVRRFGMIQSPRDLGRKIGLVTEIRDDMTGYLYDLNGAAEPVLRRATGYRQTYGYLPHLTVAGIGSEVDPRQIGELTETLDAQLRAHPLVLPLGSLQIRGYSHQTVVL